MSPPESSLSGPLWQAWTVAKNALRHPATLRAHRELAERRQRRAYRVLLKDLARVPPYREETLRARLLAKQPKRRPLLGQDGRPSVLAVGFNCWEQHGFWQAFARLGNFTMLDLGAIHGEPAQGTPGQVRLRRTEACLREIERVLERQQVSLVFVYADSDGFDPGVLANALHRRGVWLVVMGLDCKHRHYRRRRGDLWLGQDCVLPHADLMWTNWPSYARSALSRGGNAWFAPQGASPEFFSPQARERDIDVLFLGQRYGHRARFVRGLRALGIKVTTAGAGWPEGFASFEQSLALISRARVVLGYGATGAMRDITCLKGRDFEVPMAGGLYLTTYNAELSAHYQIGQEIVCYSGVEDCAEIIIDLLAHPGRQEEIRRAGRARALACHTWEARVSSLLGLFPQN